MSEVKAAIQQVESKQQTELIQKWLAPPDSSTNANRARELRHNRTGTWFLESSRFREWEAGSRRCLWLHGLPGCGKTVLITTVYDHIAQVPERIALQFYFDFGDDRKQTLDNILRGLVFQLYTFQPESTSELDDLFKRCNEGRDQPDRRAISHCLEKMLKSLRAAYVFIDALDECSERETLVKWLEGFMAISDLGHVKFIMTARPEAEFNRRISSLVEERNCVSLQTVLVNADIQSYVQSSLRERSGFKKWATTPSMLQRISFEVGSKAGGM